MSEISEIYTASEERLIELYHAGVYMDNTYIVGKNYFRLLNLMLGEGVNFEPFHVYIAIQNNNVEIVSIFQKNGRSPDDISVAGLTLFNHAVQKKNKEIIDLLLQYNPTINKNILVDSIYDIDLLKRLLSRMTGPIDDPRYITYMTINSGNVEALKLFVDFGMPLTRGEDLGRAMRANEAMTEFVADKVDKINDVHFRILCESILVWLCSSYESKTSMSNVLILVKMVNIIR